MDDRHLFTGFGPEPHSLGRIWLAFLMMPALGNIPFALFAFRSAMFALVHVAAGTILQHLLPIPELMFSTLGIILLGTVLGAASAAVFWFIAIRGTDLSD